MKVACPYDYLIFYESYMITAVMNNGGIYIRF